MHISSQTAHIELRTTHRIASFPRILTRKILATRILENSKPMKFLENCTSPLEQRPQSDNMSQKRSSIFPHIS